MVRILCYSIDVKIDDMFIAGRSKWYMTGKPELLFYLCLKIDVCRMFCSFLVDWYY